MKNKKQKTFTETQVGALIEHVDGKFDQVVEGYAALDKRMEDFRGEVNERFQGVDYKLDMVFEELHVIRNELKEKIGRDEFQLLEKRVIALEKRASHKT